MPRFPRLNSAQRSGARPLQGPIKLLSAGPGLCQAGVGNQQPGSEEVTHRGQMACWAGGETPMARASEVITLATWPSPLQYVGRFGAAPPLEL